ncbi:hypothetical protein RBEAN4_1171 [Rickettsia bellii str. RML An4]|uniref:Uncharacterized protein n=1 Tax=Rickettsia bellii str. RML An4 TaxID=1359193 RepID=A0A0F3QFH3_RICBE|nr:hypothetical protein RBEAN4_1171 [Rickettsia bellii str. RML An4]
MDRKVLSVSSSCLYLRHPENNKNINIIDIFNWIPSINHGMTGRRMIHAGNATTG